MKLVFLMGLSGREQSKQGTADLVSRLRTLDQDGIRIEIPTPEDGHGRASTVALLSPLFPRLLSLHPFPPTRERGFYLIDPQGACPLAIVPVPNIQDDATAIAVTSAIESCRDIPKIVVCASPLEQRAEMVGLLSRGAVLAILCPQDATIDHPGMIDGGVIFQGRENRSVPPVIFLHDMTRPVDGAFRIFSLRYWMQDGGGGLRNGRRAVGFRAGFDAIPL